MIELLGAGVVLGAAALVIWLGFRSARQAGASEERAKEATNVAKTAERVADATASAPRTVDDLDKRLSDGGRI